MKKLCILLLVSVSILFGFNLENFAKSVVKSTTTDTASNTESSKSALSNDTISSALKEALQKGVQYATTSLGKKDGYLNNNLVKIPLPETLQKVESLVRKAGGDKIADDLIQSMNTAASKAAPKTAEIFIDAIKKMSLADAKTILNGGNEAATEYFKSHTDASLKTLIAPIVETSMNDNNVAKYYDTFNNYYQQYGKKYVQNSTIGSFAKKFGADAYLPDASEENLNDYVTQKAIDGLFVMIAQQEKKIRENPVEQTTSLLKKVFGK
ncbi:DUF4197 domain-containing protein [Sulfurospirillum sp. 1612]|uniref:DUF4197 domain-containing protein n=1 Tax=Sulfurospirillum sp. 1612 TaxID=3094835 RepID=UPI002F936D29